MPKLYFYGFNILRSYMFSVIIPSDLHLQVMIKMIKKKVYIKSQIVKIWN
jgi:hypothetical protein